MHCTHDFIFSTINYIVPNIQLTMFNATAMIDIIQSLSDPSYSGKKKFEFSPKVSQINPMTFFQHTSRML